MARNMVTKWGLSEQLGPIAYGEEDDEVFLGRSVTQHKQRSNDTARRIDEEVRNILDKAYARTTQLLTENIDKLHAMSQLLLQYETIDAPQIDAIMEGRDPPPPAGWSVEQGRWQRQGRRRPSAAADRGPGRIALTARCRCTRRAGPASASATGPSKIRSDAGARMSPEARTYFPHR